MEVALTVNWKILGKQACYEAIMSMLCVDF